MSRNIIRIKPSRINSVKSGPGLGGKRFQMPKAKSSNNKDYIPQYEKSYEQIFSLQQYLKDKRIAVVGNASIKDLNGIEIDNHDVIIRFNFAFNEYQKYTKYVGSRTDILVLNLVSAKNSEKILNSGNEKDLKFILRLKPTCEAIDNNKIFSVFKDDYEYLRNREFKNHDPSSGMMLLYLLQKYIDYKELNLYGMDGFKTSEKYPNQKNEFKSFLYVAHNSNMEQNFLKNFKRRVKPIYKSDDRISAIITFRKNNEYRIKNIETVIKWLRTINRVKEIIVVEQDSEKKLTFDKNINHIFAYNPNLFAKTWGYNIGVKNAKFDNLMFCDADCFVPTENMNSFLDKYFMSDYSAGSPYPRKQMIRLSKNDSQYVYDNLNELNRFSKNLEFNGSQVLGDGIFIITKEAMNSMKLWDESFIGWGYQGHTIQHALEFLNRKVLIDKFIVYHLFHESVYVTKDTDYNKEYLKNFENNKRFIYENYKNSNSEKFKTFLSSIDINKKGNLEKYKND